MPLGPAGPASLFLLIATASTFILDVEVFCSWLGGELSGYRLDGAAYWFNLAQFGLMLGCKKFALSIDFGLRRNSSCFAGREFFSAEALKTAREMVRTPLPDVFDRDGLQGRANQIGDEVSRGHGE